MIYNRNTRELKTDDGKLLKKLDCPLHKEWSQLKVIPDELAIRRCNSCKKSVFHLADKNDQEAELLFQQQPDCCVYVAPNAGNIRITGYKRERPDPCPFRRIQTARGREAINQAVKEGFWPLVKPVKRSPKVSSWMEVYQNQETGEIRTVGDHRYPPTAPWKRVVKPFSCYPYHFEHSFAAYLLPSDLHVGERVFLIDLIEDLVSVWGNQGHTYRLDSAYAIWNGKDFKIQWNERTDAEVWIG